MKFLHITNAVNVNKNRDLYYAQPITFETYRVAKNFIGENATIVQCSVQYAEDDEIIPEYISVLPNLVKSLRDFGDFKYKFPLINEILSSAYAYSNDVDYIIFSNVDIALKPYFYDSILRLIEKGHDAIIINRRSISDKFKSLEDLPLMWAEVGIQHPGWDCFVFKRILYPKFNFGNGVIGAVSSGRIILSNLMYHAKNPVELKNPNLTFHLGFSPTKTRQYSSKKWIKANLFNDEQLETILAGMVENASEKDLVWIHRRLDNLNNRRKRYYEGLHGAKRFPGYWGMKRVTNLFGYTKDPK